MTVRYISPGLRPPCGIWGQDIKAGFIHAVEMDPKDYHNAPGHAVFCDPTIFPGCGFATDDEGAILTALVETSAHTLGGGARKTMNRNCSNSSIPLWERQPRWLEFGSHTGWTAAHMISGGAHVTMVDPEYAVAKDNLTGEPLVFRGRVVENLANLGFLELQDYRTFAMTSREFVDLAFPEPDAYEDTASLFDGVFIDGNHEAPFPLKDARMARDIVKPGGLIVFHDALGGPVQEAIAWLVGNGWRVKIYRTAQLMAVCYKDGVELPEHTPDPNFDWDRWLAAIKVPGWLAKASLGKAKPPDPLVKARPPAIRKGQRF